MSERKPDVMSSASSSKRDMTDEQFDKWLPTFLRSYLKEKLQPREVVTRAEGFPQMIHSLVQPITDPMLASAIVAYISLNAQKRQAKTNAMLQALILLVAAVNVVAILVPYLFPR
jgi:hypothetical protein